MATALSDIIFVICAVAIAIAQWLILRSTARGMKYADGQSAADAVAAVRPNRAPLEWAYAIVPTFALVALLIFSWRAMHPGVVKAQGVVPQTIGTDA